MPWFVVVAVAVVGMVGAAFALAGPSGGGARAYALVNPNGGSHVLVADHTAGFTEVSIGPVGTGDYCLTRGPGVNVDSTAASASMEAFYSGAIGVAAVR
jgi:hypothetical protein